MIQLPWVFIVIIAVRILFIVTYSPNVGGDSANYLNMFIKGTSNLIHASGYPFLMGMPFHGVAWLYKQVMGQNLSLTGNLSLYLLIITQHLISITVLYWAHKNVKEIFSHGIADGFALLYGLNVGGIAATSQIYPEWLQANLLMLYLIALYKAFTALTFCRKMILYSLSSFIFVLAYLVKYNAIFFALVFFIVLLIDTGNWIQKITIAVTTLLIWFSVTWEYKILYHYPTTGTYTLSHDKAWVLLTKVGAFMPLEKFSPEVGINTKRLLLLNSMLPWDNKNVHAISNVNEISPAIESYRKKYMFILTAEHNVLDRLLSQISLVKKFDFFTAFSPTTYYLGLKEGDELGVKVFMECVFSYPFKFAEHILKLTCRDLIRSNRETIFPIVLDTKSYQEKTFGFFAFDQSKLKKNGTDMFSNPNGYYVWKPGVKFFSWLVLFFQIPNGLVSIVCLIGVILILAKYISNQTINANEFIYFFLAIMVLGFIVFSNALFFFRWSKELILVMPIISLLLSVSINNIIKYFRPTT